MLTDTQQERIESIARTHVLDLVVLFGSVARGTTHRRSDLDVAVRGVQPLTLREQATIALAFAPVFGRSDIDVRDLRTLPPRILRGIARDGIVCFERVRGSFARFQTYAMHRYVETAPLRRLRRERLRRRIGV